MNLSPGQALSAGNIPFDNESLILVTSSQPGGPGVDVSWALDWMNTVHVPVLVSRVLSFIPSEL